jgi:hypothetical protein
MQPTVNEGQFRTNLLSAGTRFTTAASLIDRAFDELLTFDHCFLPRTAATVGAVTGSAARLTLGFLTVSWRATMRTA